MLELKNQKLFYSTKMYKQRIRKDSALQPLKSGTLSLHLSVAVPVLIPSVVTSRPTTASMPSNPLNPSPLVPHIRLLLTIVRI